MWIEALKRRQYGVVKSYDDDDDKHPMVMTMIMMTIMMMLMMKIVGIEALWTPCQNVCGDIPVMYPFGTSKGCGSKAFEKYVNCSKDKGKMVLHTPMGGTYNIKKIDYTNNILIITDPTMSTCDEMQQSSSFGLPVDAPFSIVSTNHFVLLGCHSEVSGSVSGASMCDPTGTSLCKALYSCPSITNLGLSINSPTSSCCVYANSKLNNPPFELNLPLLQCTSYTSIYSFGSQYEGFTSSGNSDSSSSSNVYLEYPNNWSYGIALKFYYDESTYSGSCNSCQVSNGVCAYNVYGFVCICSGVNTTTNCFGTPDFNAGTKSRQSILDTFVLQGLVGLVGMMKFGVWF